MRIPFKRGDTFLMEGTVMNGDVAQDITGWAIRSQVRQGNALIADLEIEYVNRPLGVYRLRKTDTSEWPAKTLVCDIEYTTNSGQVASTDTFEIDTKADVTR